MKNLFLTFIIVFLNTISSFAQEANERSSNNTESEQSSTLTKQSKDIGVVNVEYFKNTAGKHYISVQYSNFGSSAVSAVRLKYKINNNSWKTLNPIPGSIASGAKITDPKIPFNSVGFTSQTDGIVTGGSINIIKVCTTWNDANSANDCKTLSVTIF